MIEKVTSILLAVVVSVGQAFGRTRLGSSGLGVFHGIVDGGGLLCLQKQEDYGGQFIPLLSIFLHPTGPGPM